MPIDVADVLWTELSAPSSSEPVGVCSVVCLAPLYLHQLSLLGPSSTLLLHLHSAPSVALAGLVPKTDADWHTADAVNALYTAAELNLLSPGSGCPLKAGGMGGQDGLGADADAW